MTKKQKKNWLEHWKEPWFDNSRLDNFNLIDKYINFEPKNILDIGCGLAYEVGYFQKKYNSKIYLLDGDVESTPNNIRDIDYGPVEDFKFYNKLDDLHKSYKERNLIYQFFDCNKIKSTHVFDTKFDLILSNLSCGFHYPAKTYKQMILNNSDKHTIIIMDFQKKLLHQQQDDINIINVISQNEIAIKLHITFK